MSAATKTPAELRRQALALLAGQMQELDEDGETAVPLHVRRAAAEAILKHTSEEEADGAPKKVLEMSDQELLQVIVDHRNAQEAAASPPVVPRETSVAERLAQSLAGLADPVTDRLLS